MSRESRLPSTGCPRLLLLDHLILVVLGLHLISVVVNAQILDLQLQHLHLVFKSPILNLLLDVLVVCSAQFVEELVGVCLEFLQPH